ncbi:TonB-dependent receptor [Nitrospirillum viridazoti]|uniref:TonB-dependent receptor n=1 Tax=Nitrospirillum viridazoti CBAmc TaxID=1441467 RepID=A0A248K0M6_9PROT|nr:TonB-dependent receptor [Nitrospirillum amazonense]ASG24527.1 TonB-dependent receptor [Nitrospirillum amazonense CBAmc]TWB37121.1 outer membrane receptor protein involved in Fe transport [Nitrospirillum amazonense]
MNRLAYAASLVALLAGASAAVAQTTPVPAAQDSDQKRDNSTGLEEILVTATRRAERLQDVPISITAFSQDELTQKGIVGVEGIARETPGVVLDHRSDNNLSVTTRGISVNGYEAGLQSTTTVYLDDLPLTTIGNSVTLDPSLFDVERVEFLRGPQGTLFGSGSLSGALRILTKSPDLNRVDASVLTDTGYTPDAGAVRQRYNGMVNVPLVDDKLGVRVVGFYRHEDGYVDNVGTGVKNSNTLKDWGGRGIILWKPTDRLSIRLMGLYEDSHPQDASLVTPSLGDRKRYTTMPDLYTSKSQLYNATIDYQFDWAHLTSSTSYGYQDGLFDVDLAGTFALALPFNLFDHGIWKTVVQETRLVSEKGGRFDWTVGTYYLHRDQYLAAREASTPAYLATHGITGLPADGTFYSNVSNSSSYELAGFGELTYHITDTLSAIGGLRYGKYATTVDVAPGFNSLYFAYALGGIRAPLALTPTPASSTAYPDAEKASWKASLTYEPSHDLTLYATVSTGYRTPVYNARAGSVSTVSPTDLVIPTGASSDDLTNYEIGLKGRWWDGRLTANLAAYYIDWQNLQVQANRVSDSVQFATNIGAAESKGLEAEVTLEPVHGLVLGLNAAVNDAKVTGLSAQEAQISGAVNGASLASPHLQGSFFGTYGYTLFGTIPGFSGFQVQHVGSFPVGFPNTPGTLGKPSALYDHTDSYTLLNLQTGATFGKVTATLYGENLTNSRAITYVHPEAFVYSRYAIVRPLTFGLRLAADL